MKVRRPRHRAEIRQPPHIATVQAHGVNIGDDTFLIEAAPDDALAVGREKRTAIVAGREGETALIRAVGIHDVDFAVSRGISCAVGRVAQRTEYDFRSIRRIRAFGVIAEGVGQASQSGTVAPATEDVHLVIIIPRVTAGLAGGAKLQFGLLLCLRFRIEMRGRKEHFV